MAMRVYFDGSQFDKQVLTLAGLAGDSSVWGEIESCWEYVLKVCNAPSMHMTDLMALQGNFRGWTEDRRSVFLEGLFIVFERYSRDPRLFSSTASVDLVAHKKFKRIRNHPSPARLCSRFVFPHILEWYERSPVQPLERMELCFDRGEQFMRHVTADWESKTARRKYPAWDIVKSIGQIDQKDSPALQMSDMIAWGRTQLVLGMHPKHEHHTVAFKSADTIHGIYRDINAHALAEATFVQEFSETLSKQFRSGRM